MDQATTARQPTLSTTTNLLNGLPTVNFNGTASPGNLLDATNGTLNASGISLFSMCRPNPAASSGTFYYYCRLISGWPATADDYNQTGGFLYTTWTSARNKFDYYRQSANRVSSGAFTVNTWNQLGFTRASGTNNVRNYLNGNVTFGTDASQDIAVTHIRLGNNSAMADSAYNGDIAEWIFFNSTLSVADADKVVGYLAWKWGQQTSLASTHPYRYQAP
jgi:hypothetical protein